MPIDRHISDAADRILATLPSREAGSFACILWEASGGSDVAIVDCAEYLAWWPTPSQPPPRILWWTHGRWMDTSNLAHALVDRGIRGMGSPNGLGEDLAAPLRAHVRRPAPVTCHHCGAPAAGDATTCRYCEAPLAATVKIER